MKRFWCVFLAFLFAGFCVKADDKCSSDPNTISSDKWDIPVKDPNDPSEVVKAKWLSVVNVLKDKSLDTPAKELIIDKLLSPAFDFQLMGKLSLGKTNWPKLNAAQREKFMSLFVDRLKASYREKIMLYDDEEAVFEPAVPNKDNVQIAMTLVYDEQRINLLYKLRKAEKSWKVYDVEIEGVSILLTYRSQFDDILRRGSVDDLLSQLEKPTGSKTAPSQS
jgi:phospholipid transport system substrate-binding protein